MTQEYIQYPAAGSGSGVPVYANFAAFPASADDGSLAVAQDTDILYIYDAGSSSWKVIGGPGAVLGIGTIDSQTKSANGAVVASNALVMQTADATRPGLMSATTQTIAGAKTFTGAISASNFSGSSSGTNTGDVSLGTANGLSIIAQALSLGLSSTSTTGALSSTDWNTFNGKQSTLTIGNLTAAGTDGIAVTGGTGSIIGSGVSLAQQVSDATHNGYLSSADWVTFNNKGSGTVTAVSVASANGFAGGSSGGATPALTLSTTITGVIKGNGTAISTAVAGTDFSAGTAALTTGILKSTTTTGALTIAVAGDFPTLNQNTSGTAAGLSATLAIGSGGTGQTSSSAAFNALSPMTTGGDLIYGGASGAGTRLANGSSGQFLKSNGTTLAPSWGTPTLPLTAPTVQKFTSGSGTYTKPANVLYISVEMAGGGGGGGGTTSGGGGTAGGAGGNSTFGSSLLTANGGDGGGAATAGGGGGAVGGAGGTASISAPALSLVVNSGANGGGGTNVASGGNAGGEGGQNGFGGGAGMSAGAGAGGVTAVANTGGGGSGGPGGGGVSASAGGGASGYLTSIITSPSSTYAYAVGAAGAAGTGTFADGGAGAAGVIIVTEYYQ